MRARWLRLGGSGSLLLLCLLPAAAGCGGRYAGPPVQKIDENKFYYPHRDERRVYEAAIQTCHQLALTDVRTRGGTLQEFLIGARLPAGRGGFGGQPVNIKILRAATGIGSLIQFQIFNLDEIHRREWTKRFYAELHARLNLTGVADEAEGEAGQEPVPPGAQP